MSAQGIKRLVLHFTSRYMLVTGMVTDIWLDFNGGIGLVRMMGTTNYLALAGGGKSPKFAINKVLLFTLDP